MAQASKPGCEPTPAPTLPEAEPQPRPGGPAGPQPERTAGAAPGEARAAAPREEAEDDPKKAPPPPPRPARADAPQPPAPRPPAPEPAAAQLAQKAHELMWYVLAREQKRLGLWFPDMVRDVLGGYKKWCRGIVRRAGLLLARVFGLRLRLRSLHTMEFALVKALAPAELERVALGNRMPMTGLLLMILSLIYVKGRGAREGAVWNVLRILGLRPWKKHSTFGDVRRLVTRDFVQQDYLQYQRVPHVEPPEYEFFWGARARREISKLQIMEFLARVFKKDPQAWPARYREALDEARALRERERELEEARDDAHEAPGSGPED